MVTKLKNVNIGALSEFIDLLSDMQNEFNGQTLAISSIDTNNRDMYARIATQHGLFDLTLDYRYDILSIKSFNEQDSSEVISFIKKVLLKFEK